MFTIGIAGDRRDTHVRSLVEECEKMGQEAVVLDFHGFPRYNLLTVSPECGYDDLVHPGNIDPARLDLLLIRNLVCGERIDASGRENFLDSCRRGVESLNCLYSLVRSLEIRIPVINTLRASAYHRCKTAQYFFLAAAGISVPATLVTNDPCKAHAFCARFNGRVIAKPQASGAEVVMADDEFFRKNRDILPGRPFLFQQFVQGRSFRAYLLGGELDSAAEIHFDRSYVDWRERTTSVIPWQPPQEVKQQLEKAVRLLGLAYCAVDFEFDSGSGKYYFLDFNPSGLFTGWSNLVKINMAQRIVSYLVKILENGNSIWLSGR